MPIVEVRELTKIYGSGDTAVTALDHVDLTVEQGEFVAVMGPERVRQVDAAQPRRWAGQAHERRGAHRRHRHRNDVGSGRHRAAPSPARLRLPVLQPHPGADHRRERRAAADARRRQARRGTRSRTGLAAQGRPRRQAAPADRTSSPADSSSASPSRARSSPIRRSSSPTNPPATSTASRPTRSPTCSSRRPTSGAARSSWSRTT